MVTYLHDLPVLRHELMRSLNSELSVSKRNEFRVVECDSSVRKIQGDYGTIEGSKQTTGQIDKHKPQTRQFTVHIGKSEPNPHALSLLLIASTEHIEPTEHAVSLFLSFIFRTALLGILPARFSTSCPVAHFSPYTS